MALIPAGALADLRAVRAAAMPDTCTITRAGAVVATGLSCALIEQSGEVHLAGLPTYVRLRRWRCALPVTTDVRVSDQITSGGCTYVVQETLQPRSYATAAVALVVLIATPTSTFPIMTNATVTVNRYDQTGTLSGSVSVAVWIEPRTDDEQIVPNGTRMVYEVCYPLATTIGGIPISAGDELVWSGLARGKAELHTPAQHLGLFPYATAKIFDIV